MERRWLVAVDNCSMAWYAFNYTLSLIDRRIDHVYVLHVKEPGPFPSWFKGGNSEEDPIFVREAQFQKQEKSKQILAFYGCHASSFNVKHLIYIVALFIALSSVQIKCSLLLGLNAEPGEVICKAVENHQISICVVGQRKLGNFRRTLSMSTSQYVLENAECTVLVVKNAFYPPELHDRKEEIVKREEDEVKL